MFGTNFWLLNILDSFFLPFLYISDWGKKYTIRQIDPQTKFKFRVNSSDIITTFEVWKNKVYNQLEIEKGNCVVDIGAHIGSFSIFAAQKSLPGKVFAYEASQENFNLLSENTHLNQIKNIHPYNLAVSSKSGQINFYIHSNKALNFIFPYGGQLQTVNSISLSDIFNQNHLDSIDVLKIDTEGAEYDILISTPTKFLKKIKNIILEYHEIDTTHNSTQLKKFLEKHGFHTKITGSLFQKWLFGTGYLTARSYN